MLKDIGIHSSGNIYRNQDIDSLVRKAVERKEGIISKSGALSVHTGKYNGCSPDDRYIVDTPGIHDKINWGKVNRPIKESAFERLYDKITGYISGKDEIFVLDGRAGADRDYSMNIRVINEHHRTYASATC